MVRKALPRLSATAEIETIDGKHAVVDPLFAEWVERINEGLPDPGVSPDDASVEITATRDNEPPTARRRPSSRP